MTERLRAFLERAEQLPPDAQERLIEEIEDVLDNAEWHVLLADPRSSPVLDELIAQAQQSRKRPWPTLASVRS